MGTSTRTWNGKRFDKKIKNFVISIKLTDTSEMSIQTCEYTYAKAEYRSKIDHILVNEIALKSVESSFILDHAICLSDHNPVNARFTSYQNAESSTSDFVKEGKFYHFPWHKIYFINMYQEKIKSRLVELENELCMVSICTPDTFNYIYQSLSALCI